MHKTPVDRSPRLPQDRAAPSPKRAYVKPKLAIYGDLRQVTLRTRSRNEGGLGPSTHL